MFASLRTEKMQDLLENNSRLLYHDNAPAHTARNIKKFLEEINITVVEQPPYCQILLHATFSFSPKLQGVKKVPDPKQNYIGLMTEG